MKKLFPFILFSLTVFVLMIQSAPAEAAHHRHRGVQIQVNLGNGYCCQDAYVVRRYAPPIMPAPVVVASPYYAPVVVAPPYGPTYISPPPVYMTEEVRVVPEHRRPVGFAGFSFSWR